MNSSRPIGGLARAALLLAALILAGCASSPAAPATGSPAASPAATSGPSATAAPPAGGSGELAFATLAQGDSTVAAIERPALFVGAAPGDLQPFLGWLADPSQAEQLSALPLADTVVVALFDGPVSSSGHRITIESVRLADGAVQIVARRESPPAGQINADVISYPYHVVTLDRAALGQSLPATWTVSSPSGDTIAQASR